MLLVNRKQLEVGEALNNTGHPLHAQAVEYNDGLKQLRDTYGKEIKFIRPGFPKKNKGEDSKGRETMLTEPTPPMLIPLQSYHAHPTRGKELWGCCLGLPKPIEGNMWDIGDKRSLKIEDFKIVSLDKEPDLAFYLYYISASKKKGRIKVDNPKVDLAEKAAKEMEVLERKTAIWSMLQDENLLVRMASSYGIQGADKKDPNAVRFELESLLESNDLKKKRDRTIKGTSEFLEEMKVTDAVRLRAFLRKQLDNKVIEYKLDGKFKIADKVLMQVPYTEVTKGTTFEYLCNFYHAPNNADKLRELMTDTVSKEYLDNIKDDRDYGWLAKVMGITVAFKKKEEVKELVYSAFNIAL